MKLLSKELVSLEYREALQQDLAKATVCRFLVAYVSTEGLNSLHRHLLLKALRDPRSFGVASLTCSCGYEPLLSLQQQIGISTGLRLKYFMDPIVKEPGEPSDLALFHSKLVYLLLERERRRALGIGGPRNAEASLRFEIGFSPEDLDGTGTSLASHVNRHLLDAWTMPLCLPAILDNEPSFREWYEKGCRRAPTVPLEDATIILAVHRNPSDPAAEVQWQNLAGRGIYLQVLEEEDGQLVWRSNDSLLVLVWKSQSDLQQAKQPLMLKCRITTSKAGPNSQLRGTNQSTSPIAGFQAVIWDEAKCASLRASSREERASARTWSGRDVDIYDFEFPATRTDSSQIDGGIRPRYQFHLEVEHVVFPADGDYLHDASLLWERETFAVAESRDSAKIEEKPGFYVEPRLRDEMIKCLREVLYIDPESARVLPFSEMDRHKVGKRVSRHPLHDTYIGKEWKQHRDAFYEKTEAGALVPELDDPRDESPGELAAPASLFGSSEMPIPHVQRVYTMPLEKLEQTWRKAAENRRHHRRKE